MGKTLTAADVLEKAHALISNKDAYHPAARAMSKTGALVEPRGKAAVKWSVRGAIERSARDNGIAETKALKIFAAISGDEPEVYCLVHPHKRVLIALNNAVSMARALERVK